MGLMTEATVSKLPEPQNPLFVVSGHDSYEPADRSQLLASGFEHVHVQDTEGALGAMEGVRPLMVLVEEKVAIATEGEIVGKLRAHPINGDVPLVLLAKKDTAPELIESCYRAGLDDYIIRPLDAQKIVDRANAVLGRSTDGAVGVSVHRRTRTVGLGGPASPYRAQLADYLRHNGFHVRESGPSGSVAELDPGLGIIDLVVIVDDLFRVGALDAFSQTVKAFQRTNGGLQTFPIVVVSDNVVAGPTHRAPPGIQLLDRKAPLPEVLNKVVSLLHQTCCSLRAEARVPFFCPVEFREAGGLNPGPWCSGFTFNVSSGGLFVRTLVPCRPGAPVEIKIRLTTTRDELDVTGVVAWANRYVNGRPLASPIGMGIQFLGAISKKMAQLIEICRSGVE